MVHLSGDLLLESPEGGRIRIVGKRNGTLQIRADAGPTLWELARLAQEITSYSRTRRFRTLRNLLDQNVEIYANDELLFYFKPGSLPRPGKAGAIIRFLRRRKRR